MTLAESAMKMDRDLQSVVPITSDPNEMLGVSLSLSEIGHSYGSFQVLHDFSLDVDAGEIVSLLGPSGCGKSTVLRIVAGFVRQQMGSISVDGKCIDRLPANRRHIGMVFQNYALFPHLTVRENVAYGLQAQRQERRSIRRRVDEVLQLVKLADYADRLPRELSGGQQQRVATARALAVQPRVLLLDEPFGALDKNLRLDMQIEFLRIQRQFGITSVMVTHDQEEALSISNRVVVINQGRIEQVGTPAEVYDEPASLFVNQFVGTTNVLSGKIVDSSSGGTRIEIPACGQVVVDRRFKFSAGAKVFVTGRPEHVSVSDTPNTGALSGTVDAVLPVGPMLMYEILLTNGERVKVNESRRGEIQPYPRGQKVYVSFPVDQCQVFPGEGDGLDS